MQNFPDTEKKIKARISSYKSSLQKEMKTYGCINDGSGKRYMLFWLYFALNDLALFEEYINWYTGKFPDNAGEPAQKLCWAVGLWRMGKETEAKHMLADLMISNLYLIPQLSGQSVKEYDIWHFSNYEHPDYYEHIPEKLISLISVHDLEWMAEQYNSFVFRRIRKKYIEIYGKLKSVKDIETRKALLNEARSIMGYLTEKHS